MGDMHKKVTDIKLDGSMGLIILVIAILFGPFATMIAGVLAKGDAMTAGIVIGLVQWFAVWFFFIGYFWCIYTSFKIYSNSK